MPLAQFSRQSHPVDSKSSSLIDVKASKTRKFPRLSVSSSQPTFLRSLYGRSCSFNCCDLSMMKFSDSYWLLPLLGVNPRSELIHEASFLRYLINPIQQDQACKLDLLLIPLLLMSSIVGQSGSGARRAGSHRFIEGQTSDLQDASKNAKFPLNKPMTHSWYLCTGLAP